MMTRPDPDELLARVRAAERRLGGVGLDQARLCAAITPDHVAMEIVASGIGGPFIADERREAARIIRLFGRLDRLPPCAAVGGRARGRETLGQLALAETGDDIDCGRCPLAGIDLVVPFPPLGRRHQHRIGRHELREKAHAVGVIRHHQEIQRPRELRMLTAGGDYLFALGETVRIFGSEPCSKRAGVHGK